jgi:opacity protein-like surface antigen
MKKTLLLLIPTLLLTSVSALAEAAPEDKSNGFYLGGSVGQSTSDLSSSDFNSDYKLDKNDISTKLFAGYELSEMFSIEAGYMNLGENTLSYHDSYTWDNGVAWSESDITTIEASALIVNLLANYSISEATSLYAKLGMSSWNAKATNKYNYIMTWPGYEDDTESYEVSVKEDGTDVFFGVGISFNLENFKLFGEYEKYKMEDLEVDVLAIGAAYYF